MDTVNKAVENRKGDPVTLSIVVPLHNEELNLEYLFARLESVLTSLKSSYEIVCVDDGSKDNTLMYLIQHHHRNPAIKVVSLSRNFGKEIALTAGIDYASGAAHKKINCLPKGLNAKQLLN